MGSDKLWTDFWVDRPGDGRWTSARQPGLIRIAITVPQMPLTASGRRSCQGR